MRKYIKHTLRILSVLLVYSSLYAQAPRAVYSNNEILIGEQVEISLKVGYPGVGNEVIFPSVADTIIKNVEVLSKSKIDTINESGAIKLSQTIVITSFDTGYYALPPFEFKVNGETKITEAFLLSVKNPEIDTTAFIKDIKDIYQVPVGIMDYIKVYWPYIAGTFAILAGIIALLIYFSKRKRKPIIKEEIIIEEPKLPPHTIALNALLLIKKEKLWSRDLIKEYHTRITDVLRTYIEQRFKVKAQEQTSAEIMRNLRFADISDEAKSGLRRILLLADLVKFAKEKPLGPENEQSVDDAITFVKLTEKREEEKELNQIEEQK